MGFAMISILIVAGIATTAGFICMFAVLIEERRSKKIKNKSRKSLVRLSMFTT